FVAARLHPEFFANDSLLGVPANFYFYVALHLPLVATLGEWLGGNYGLATAYLFLPHLFLQGVGFYLLGKELFRDRFWSMLLVGITFLPFSMNWGEFWGTLYDVMPRVTFQVLLPYVLWVTVRWRNSVKKWPYVLMLAGLLIYVHPVSAPAWILSIWLSLVVGTSKTTFKNNVVDGIRAGLALLVVVLPYVWFYLTNYAHGEVIDYALTRQIWSERLYPGFVDLGYGFREFINVIVIEREVELFIVGGLAVLFSFLPLRQHDAALARLLQVWLVGILLASVVIPIIDFSIAVHLERLPLQVDLVRNLRYLFPLLLLFSLWAPFVVASGALFGLKLSDRGPRVVLVLTLFWCAWLAKFHQPSMALDAVKCMVARNLFCPISQQERQAEEVLNAIRTLVPPDQSILANALVLEIRYHALRSVAFASKDGGA
ncbi:MAG: hypothetical protein KJZ53_05870, partial [Anaerolineales bacterium]|nr:hypothetical protein [Anaerolineales bacterium]